MKKPLLSELTLSEKIGQMLLPYQYNVNTDQDPVTKKLKPKSRDQRDALIREEKYGAYWAQTGLGNRGIDVTLRSNTKAEAPEEYGEFLQGESDAYWIPALTALDAEEDGIGPLFDQLTITCCPNAQGAANDEQLSYELAAAVARELRCAGCNWRWAPYVDIANRFTMGVMRRIAPDDTERNIRLALAQIRGTQSEGVAATAKHFPGGDENEYRDSHFCATIIRSTKEEWAAEQGRIFKAMIDGGVYSIMITHKAFPAVDDSKINGRFRPSTISKKVITDLLKGELGFQGVVITDGIVMASLFTLMPYEQLLVELVNAGNDVILGVPQNGSGKIIEQAVLDGRISEGRINDACQRVLDMKEKLGMFEDSYRLVKYKAEEVAPSTKKINMQIARKAIDLIRDRNQLLPMNASKVKNVAIICSTHAEHFVEELGVLVKELEQRGITVHFQRRLSSQAELQKIAAENDLILYAVWIGPHEPMGGMNLYGDECKTYLWAFSEGKEKSIGVSFGYPYVHYDLMENADVFINTYGQSPELMKVLVEAIFGETPFLGQTPIKLEPSLRKW